MSKTRFNLTEKGTERKGGAGLAASPKQLGAQTTTNEQREKRTNKHKNSEELEKQSRERCPQIRLKESSQNTEGAYFTRSMVLFSVYEYICKSFV